MSKEIREAFEVEADEVGFCLDQKWGDYENPYENSDTALAFNLFKKGWLAKTQAVPKVINVGNELQSWVAVWSFKARHDHEDYIVVDANLLAEKIEKLTGANA